MIHHGNQFKKILHHGSWYLTSSLATKVVQFFLLPVYTRFLSPTEYGVLNTLYSVANILPVFISLYLDAAFSRYYYLEKAASKQKVRSLYSTHFWFVVAWGGFMLGLFSTLSPYTIQPLLDLPFSPYMPLIILPALFNQLAAMGLIYLKAELKAKTISFLNMATLAASTLLVLVMLIPMKMGIVANLSGVALSSALNFIFFVFLARKKKLLAWQFKGAMLVRSLKFSVPLIPAIAGSWIYMLSDRLILAYYGKLPEVGLYSLSAQIAIVIYMINDAMTQVQGPIGMSSLTENRRKGKAQITEFVSFYVWVVLLFYLGLMFFSKELLWIFADERYQSAYRLVGVLALIYVLSGLYRVFTTILSFNEKTWVISSAAILSACLNVALNFIFIPIYGQVAAAWASVFSMFAYTAWIVIWAQAYDPIKIQSNVVASCFAGAFLCIVLFLKSDMEGWFGFWDAVFFKSTLIGLYVSLLFVLPVFRPLRHRILGMWHR